jgi:hypothetical protein
LTLTFAAHQATVVAQFVLVFDLEFVFILALTL